MDERNQIPEEEIRETPEQEGYAERPAWQVWGARIGLVVFLIFVVFQLMSIAGGGL